MKHLRLRLSHTDRTIHPVHEFEIRHPDIHGSALVHWNPGLSETNAMIFRVDGNSDVYRAMLENREETVAYSIAPVGSDRFYCYICERITDRDRAYVEAIADRRVVVIPPVTYNQDRTIDVTIVGPAADVDTVLDELPPSVSVEVRSIGEYRTRPTARASSLTQRQREAMEVAFSCGYYDSPRRGSVSMVADELDISASTAAEHLRKVEAELVRSALGETDAEGRL